MQSIAFGIFLHDHVLNIIKIMLKDIAYSRKTIGSNNNIYLIRSEKLNCKWHD